VRVPVVESKLISTLSLDLESSRKIPFHPEGISSLHGHRCLGSKGHIVSVVLNKHLNFASCDVKLDVVLLDVRVLVVKPIGVVGYGIVRKA
jgi:hypothetical protein